MRIWNSFCISYLRAWKAATGGKGLLKIDPHGLEQKHGVVFCHIHILLCILSHFGKVSAPTRRVWEETWRSGWMQRAALCKLECCTLCQIAAVTILVCRVKAGVCGFHLLWEVVGYFFGISQNYTSFSIGKFYWLEMWRYCALLLLYVEGIRKMVRFAARKVPRWKSHRE